jgi:hypothetical protein
MWANLRTFGAALLALGLAAACGKTNTTESGETHFVMCDTDVDCEGVSGAHTCSSGLCQGPANESSASGSSSTGTPTPACAGGCGASDCAAPGTCSLAAACAVVDCGSIIVDDNACVRPACQTDDDCPQDERCASIYQGRHYDCKQSGNSCDCQAGLGLFPLEICSPTKLTGVRGQWQKLVTNDIVIGDGTERTVLRDGTISIKRDGLDQGGPSTSTAQLSTEDLDQLARLINGPLLRLDLAREQDCPLTKETDYLVELTLDTTTLSDNVAGCLGSVASFSELRDLLGKY